MDYDTLRRPKEQDVKRDGILQQNEAIKRIPTLYQRASFENYITTTSDQQQVLAAVKRYVATFPDRLKTATSLIFSGDPGTGKTHLSWSLYRQLIQAGHAIEHTHLPQLLERYEHLKNEKWQRRSEVWTKAELLIIDEVDVDCAEASWKKAEIRKILFEIVNARYEATQKPILLITNFNISVLSDVLGEKSIDRILHGGCALIFRWPSYRAR